MKDSTIIKRYIVFILGLFVNSLGVALITKAALGTSPISSIPYVLSLNYPFSLGQFTIFFSILLIFLQLLILRKDFKLEHLLQIPVSLAFGYFIDICMLLLFFIHPTMYVMKVLYLLIGCAILGVGVYMEVLANVIMLPGESFVRAVVFRWKTEFGITKVVFDVSMAVIAGVSSLILSGHLDGVREGTVIAALLVGFIARVLGKKLSFLPEKLFGTQPESKQNTSSVSVPEQPICIAIGRQYGCGGHEIAKALAERLSYTFYDREIIQMAAGTTGYMPEYIEKTEEKMSHSLLYDLVNEMYGYSESHRPPKDRIFETEMGIMQQAAEQNSVIIGRCVDWVLRNHRGCIRVFLHAPLEYRVKTIMEREGLSEKEAKRRIVQTDRQRADNYHYYTRRMWGAASNYHLSIDTSLGMEYAENMIIDLVHQMKAHKVAW